MKRITLKIETGRNDTEPTSYKVVAEYGNVIEVSAKYMLNDKMVLTQVAENVYENEYRTRFVKVTPDRRKKPFAVRYVSGISERFSKETKFATLAEVQEYVKGHWQGADYIDGSDVFHNDFGHFYLRGCKLADLGNRNGDAGTDDFYGWTWKELAAQVWPPELSDKSDADVLLDADSRACV